MNNDTPGQLDNTTCLLVGFVIDNRLTWSSHIDVVKTSFSQKVAALKRMRHLPKDALLPGSLHQMYKFIVICKTADATTGKRNPYVPEKDACFVFPAVPFLRSQLLNDNELIATTATRNQSLPSEGRLIQPLPS